MSSHRMWGMLAIAAVLAGAAAAQTAEFAAPPMRTLVMGVPATGELTPGSPSNPRGEQEEWWVLSPPAGELVQITVSSEQIAPAVNVELDGGPRGSISESTMRFPGTARTLWHGMDGRSVEVSVKSRSTPDARRQFPDQYGAHGEYAIVARVLSTEEWTFNELRTPVSGEWSQLLRLPVEAGRVIEILASSETSNPGLTVFGPSGVRLDDNGRRRIGDSNVAQILFHPEEDGVALVRAHTPLHSQMLARRADLEMLTVGEPWTHRFEENGVQRAMSLVEGHHIAIDLDAVGPWHEIAVSSPRLGAGSPSDRALPSGNVPSVWVTGGGGTIATVTVTAGNMASLEEDAAFTLWPTPVPWGPEDFDNVITVPASGEATLDLTIPPGSAGIPVLVSGEADARVALRANGDRISTRLSVPDYAWPIGPRAGYDDEGTDLTIPRHGWVPLVVRPQESGQGGPVTLTATITDPPTIPPISAETVQGERIDTAALDDRLLLINLWGTWCGPCRLEIPALVTLQEEMRDQGFLVIGIAIDDERAAVEAAIEEFGINYPIVLDDGSLEEAIGHILPAGMIEGYPTSLFAGPNGEVIDAMRGATSNMDAILRFHIDQARERFERRVALDQPGR